MRVARESSGLKQLRDEDIAKYEQALQFDPNNASFHALLAEKYLEAGRQAEGIHEFRTAIGLSPNGPHAWKWKSKLSQALETQAGVNTYDFTVCDNCEADMPTGTKVCTRCGHIMRMNFFEWVARPENFKAIARHAAGVTLIALILLTIFSSLSLEWRACVVCALVIVGGYYFLKGVGRDSVG